MTDDTIIRMDTRGRLSVKRHIEKRGILAGLYWSLTFGANQSIILTPLRPVQTLSKEQAA